MSVFLCQKHSVLTMTHTSSQTNQQVSLCQAKLIIKAAPQNRQLQPVVQTTCLPALLLSTFQAKKWPPSFRMSQGICKWFVPRFNSSRMSLSFSQLPVLSKWCSSLLKDNMKHLPKNTQVLWGVGPPAVRSYFLVVPYLWRNVSLCALPLSPTITVP